MRRPRRADARPTTRLWRRPGATALQLLPLAVLLLGLLQGAAWAQPATPPPTTTPPANSTQAPSQPADCPPTEAAPQVPPLVEPPEDGDGPWWEWQIPWEWFTGEALTELDRLVAQAVNNWFRSLIADAVNPVLATLSHSLLATPDLTADGGRAQDLWWTSLVLANTAYVLLIVIGGVLVMTHETLQSRYALKDVAPRLVAGLLLANTSLLLCRWAIALANALSGAFLNQGIDHCWVQHVLAEYMIGPLDAGVVFLPFLIAVLLVVALALIFVWVVRVSVTIMLIVAAPLMLACYALPQTEGVARLWWRAFSACLGIQVAQALTLITFVEVLLVRNPQDVWFGLGNVGGQVDLVGIVVTGCLLLILLLLPFWITRAVFSPRTSTVVRIARTYVAGQVFSQLPRRGKP